MNLLRRLSFRLRVLMQKSRLEHEMDEEIRQHLDLAVALLACDCPVHPSDPGWPLDPGASHRVPPERIVRRSVARLSAAYPPRRIMLEPRPIQCPRSRTSRWLHRYTGSTRGC